MKLKARVKLPEHAIKELRNLFNRYVINNDPTGSDSITLEGLRSLLCDAGYDFKPATVDMMMDLIDENNSKTVEFSEFLTLVEFLTLIQIRFNDIDTDGNNKITRSELTRLTKSMGFDFNASAANFFFKMVDADGSGTIEYEEFCDFAVFIQLLYVTFECADKDHGGTLDADELFELLKTLSLPATREETRQIIRQLDHQDKGCLSFEEWVQLVFILRYGS